MLSHPRLPRRRFLSAAAGTALAAGVGRAAFAQDYPSRNVHITVPTGEGGGADRDARTFTKVWADHMKTNFEFDYYPGAAGQVGYEFYMQQEPNAYNLLFSNIGPEVIMLTLQNVGIDIGKDLVYIKKTSTEPMAVWVGPSSPFKSLEALVDEAKKRTVTVSVSRLPHPASIGMLALGEATGATFNLVPFGGGNPSAMAAITGEVDCCALPLANPISLGDQAIVLGVFADRNPAPDEANGAPAVNDAMGTKLPPLTSSRAWGIHKAAIDKYPERIEILKTTMQETLDDPAYAEAVKASGLPTAFIDVGNQEAAMAEAEATRELAIRYKDLLTGG
ncbi:MAG: hypothetical protein KDG89_02945 [Geminicoccaceae bacterium]|nr:hypothetical protein [Geminicoccaceae bacterium]